MLEPVGPLPPSVYWRRRAVATIAVVLVLAIIVFGLLNDRFLDPSNLSLITQQVAVVGTLAVAQTLIILTAGIDLSVGAVMVLTSMIIAQTATENGLPALVALLLGLVVGLAAGAFNGILLPVGIGVMLWVAWRRRDLLQGYDYPKWLAGIGTVAWLVTLFLAARSIMPAIELVTC